MRLELTGILWTDEGRTEAAVEKALDGLGHEWTKTSAGYGEWPMKVTYEVKEARR